MNSYLYVYFKYFTIGNLQEAKSKLNKAQVRSDLSSSEDNFHVLKKKKRKNPPVRDPPTFRPAKNIEGIL